MIRGTNNSLKLYSICYTMNIVAKFEYKSGYNIYVTVMIIEISVYRSIAYL